MNEAYEFLGESSFYTWITGLNLSQHYRKILTFFIKLFFTIGLLFMQHYNESLIDSHLSLFEHYLTPIFHCIIIVMINRITLNLNYFIVHIQQTTITVSPL